MRRCVRVLVLIQPMIRVKGLATLLDRIDKEQVTIAVDGSLYKHHPRLEGWMQRYISLLAPGRKVSGTQSNFN